MPGVYSTPLFSLSMLRVIFFIWMCPIVSFQFGLVEASVRSPCSWELLLCQGSLPWSELSEHWCRHAHAHAHPWLSFLLIQSRAQMPTHKPEFGVWCQTHLIILQLHGNHRTTCWLISPGSVPPLAFCLVISRWSLQSGYPFWSSSVISGEYCGAEPFVAQATAPLILPSHSVVHGATRTAKSSHKKKQRFLLSFSFLCPLWWDEEREVDIF